MRYACLVYVDPAIAFDGSPSSTAVLEEAEAYRRHLVSQHIVSAALTLPAESVTVRVRNGKARKSDGPFMETKEMLAGFVLIDADSMAEALALAEKNPMAKLGAVEVRPAVDFSKPRPKL